MAIVLSTTKANRTFKRQTNRTFNSQNDRTLKFNQQDNSDRT